jgi:hypothetical protein
MTNLLLVVSLMGSLVHQAVPTAAPPDLSGQWTLVSTTVSRDRGATEEPSRPLISDYSAFTCGLECRITVEDSTLTIETAKIEDGSPAVVPSVTIHADGQSHPIVSAVTKGLTIDASAKWDGGTLSITNMLLGRPILETISIEKNQLVVRTTASAMRISRYTRK